MKALQLVEYGRFEFVDLPVPEIGENDVLIQVRACGICGSDVHGMDGSTGRRLPPIVMGHEAAGQVAALGSNVTGWSVGERVNFDPTFYCGTCPYCLRGETNLCDNRQVPGVSCNEYRRNGAFAEFLVVPSRNLYRLPDNMTFEQAAMVEPVSVAVHGVKLLNLKKGDRVAVVGCGMIGFLIVQVLKAKGAGEVIAVDIDPKKLELAKSVGADSTCVSSAGMELDGAIEAVGITATVDIAIRSVRKGGTVSLVGNMSPKVEIPLQVVVQRELAVNGSCGSQLDYPESIELIASGAVNVSPMITARISLDQTKEYFDRLYKQEAGLMKVIVCP
jgi:L-iditol 2-dehydrogenase